MTEATRHHVHGILPLALDPETRSLHFPALVGDDGTIPVRSIDDLPDAHLEFFVFDVDQHMRLWAAGVREIGGNAVEVVIPRVFGANVCLLVRHDRERRPGDTLEEVVALRDMRSSKGGTIADEATRMRAQHIGIETAKATGKAFDEAWAPEIAVVRSSGFLEVQRNPGGAQPLDVLRMSSASFSRTKYFRGTATTRRTEDGYLTAFGKNRYALDPDLEARLRERIEAAGAVLHPGHVEIVSPTFDEELLVRMHAIAQSLETATAEALDVMSIRAIVAKHLGDAPLMKLMNRTMAGFLPAATTRDIVARQASPTKGTAMEVPSVHVRKAIVAGYLEFAWVWGNSLDPVAYGVLRATAAGRALVAGDVEAVVAHRSAMPKVISYERPTQASPVSLREAIAIGSAVDARARRALEDAVGHAARSIWNHPRSLDAHAVLAAGLAHGVDDVLLIDATRHVPTETTRMGGTRRVSEGEEAEARP